MIKKIIPVLLAFVATATSAFAGNGIEEATRMVMGYFQPLTTLVYAIGAITGLIGGMKAFDVIYSMTSGGPGDATQTVMMVMMRKGISDGFYNQGAAFGVCFLYAARFRFTILSGGRTAELFYT